MAQRLQSLSKPSFQTWMRRMKTFVFDCDGVLWRHDGPIAGAHETLKSLRALQKRVIFVSNNATMSREMYREKFLKYRFEDVAAEDIVVSSTAAAGILSARGVKKVRVAWTPSQCPIEASEADDT